MANASGYVIQYATDAGFTQNVKEQEVSGGTTQTADIDKLQQKTSYYVRVMATGEEEYSNSDPSTAKTATTPDRNESFDLDGNNAVGFGDYALFSGDFGATSSTQNWNPRSDFDRKGAVGFGDYALFSSAFGSLIDSPLAPHAAVASFEDIIAAADNLVREVPVSVSIVVSLLAPTDKELNALPNSITSIEEGSDYYVSVWVRNQDSDDPGIVTVAFDFLYDAANTSLVGNPYDGIFDFYLNFCKRCFGTEKSWGNRIKTALKTRIIVH